MGRHHQVHIKISHIPVSDLTRCNKCDKCEGRGIVKTPLSSRIINDAYTYTKKYMPTATKYISVMVRLEYFFKGQSNQQILNTVETLYRRIATAVDRFKAKHNIKYVFLTLDCRKQGSGIFSSKDKTAAIALLSDSIVSMVIPPLWRSGMNPSIVCPASGMKAT